MKIFSKNLTETDCLKRLSIPSRVLSSFPEFHGGHAVELLVTCDTVEWPIVCTVRRKGRYKKPVLSKGWRRFVLGNGLNAGEGITFHKEEDKLSSLHYRVELKRAASRCKNVHVKREMKQFGAIVTGDTNDVGGREQETAAAAVLEHFSLGLTAAGNTTDQILDRSMHGSFIDLDLTLGRRYY
ncbi:Retrovirus-related like polyprotein [Hibiscus syriacus]|uniref:Retrovirus-related like polyprotein n=1 Tax=Hibiscus syriacus TaxID=106335 RepID=A0A6A2ZFD2_HIBSY|nr:Retrovirus-related like polyprotein [Hibiscus syriacus]